MTIAKVIHDIRLMLPNAGIYVGDNASTDKTAEIAARQGATVVSAAQRGKGYVLKRLLESAEADCYVMIDGDGTYGTECVMDLCSLVLEGKADMAVGCRRLRKKNMPPSHRICNRILNTGIRVRFGVDPGDALTGLRAFGPWVKETFPFHEKGFGVEAELTLYAIRNGYRLAPMEVKYYPRPEGSRSKIRFIRDSLEIMRVFWQAAVLPWKKSTGPAAGLDGRDRLDAAS